MANICVGRPKTKINGRNKVIKRLNINKLQLGIQYSKNTTEFGECTSR